MSQGRDLPMIVPERLPMLSRTLVPFSSAAVYTSPMDASKHAFRHLRMRILFAFIKRREQTLIGEQA
jgi:hypothetical protein